MPRHIWITLIAITAMALTACAGAVSQARSQVDTPTPANDIPNLDATPLPGNLDQVTFIVDDREYSIRQLIPRDGIPPIYDPQFVSASESIYADDELVMGVAIDGDVRAYAVGIMRRHEMLNDVVGGRPILVTW